MSTEIENKEKDNLEVQLRSLKKEIRISWIIRTVFLSINFLLIIVLLCFYFLTKDMVQNAKKIVQDAKLIESSIIINDFLNNPEHLNQYISTAIPDDIIPEDTLAKNLSDVKDKAIEKVKDGVEDTKEAIKNGKDKTVKATKMVGEKIVSGAKKIGNGIKKGWNLTKNLLKRGK